MELARKTKIVATLGPATSSPEMITRLMQSGADVFRLNFSHGTNREKKILIDSIRQISGQLGAEAGILADLQGPKIRTGIMAGEGMLLVKGDSVTITTDDIVGKDGIIPTIYKELPGDVVPGSRILLDDGLIELAATDICAGNVECRVVTGGILKSNKGINLPGVQVSAPSMTEKDRVDLDFALDAGVDFIALSFVRSAEDIHELKRAIAMRKKETLVVAKIEKPEALLNFENILDAADIIMVARGDLGVEIDAEKVPIHQKKIIQACNMAGKPVITATQMLDSMIRNPRPTRAETSDVANAIIDGTDAIMLSGETAAGEYPVEAVETVVRIALNVEHNDFSTKREITSAPLTAVAQAVAESSSRTAAKLNAKAIVVFTRSGSTAALMAAFRPKTPVIAFTAAPEIRRRLTIFWGVRCAEVGVMEHTGQQIYEVEKKLLSAGFSVGDVIVITMGILETRGTTDLMKVHMLGAQNYYEVYED